MSDDDEIDIEEDSDDQITDNFVTPTVLTPTKKSDIETKSILRNQCEKSQCVSHKVHFVDDESVTSFTSSDEDSDGNDYTDLVKRKEAGGAVIEITETRKLTKTEIRNFKVQHASDLELLSSLESSTEADGLEQKEIDNSKHDPSDSELEHSEALQTLAESTSQLLNIADQLDSSTESTLTTSVNSDIEENDDSVEEMVNLDNENTTNSTELNSQQNSSDNLVSCTNNATERDIEDVPEFPDSFSVSDVEILSNVIRTKVINAPWLY